MFDHDHLPEVSWSQLEQLYIQGQQKWKETKRSILQQLHASPTFRRTATFKDELLAHLRWSTRMLRADSRVPMPVEWDSRHIVSLLELARVLNEHACSASAEGAAFALPPVTAATCLAQLLVFFKPGGVLLRDVSLSPYCVIDRKEYYRLWSAAVVHVDATHLITNLTAVLPDCVMLERHSGSGALAADLLLLTTTSSLLYVAFAWLQKSVFIKRYNYYSLVTVGFSGVVFGLKVWAGFKRGGVVYVWGVPVPARFSWVPALALTHLCVPEASFPAHLAGVVAGLLRAYALEPVLAALRHGIRWSRRRSSSGHFLQPPAASQASSSSNSISGGLQQQGSSIHQLVEQPHNWRLLHHARWLAQQSDPGGSGDGGGSAAGSSPNSRQPSAGGWERHPAAAAAAAAAGMGPGDSCQRCNSSSGMTVRGLLLDVGLQLLLTATAAGLYLVLSRKEMSGSSRLKTSFWRR